MQQAKTHSTSVLLKEERHTSTAVSFKVVDLAPAAPTETPEIKKRLEAQSQQYGHPIGSQQEITEKLKRAEEKRKQALLMRTGAASPRVAEERRQAAKKRKQAIDKENLKLFKEKCQRENEAEEKRRQTREERQQKLRKHIEKVTEVCREQAELR